MTGSESVIFTVVVGARLLVPLLIFRYPLPAILACLVIDGVDQTRCSAHAPMMSTCDRRGSTTPAAASARPWDRCGCWRSASWLLKMRVPVKGDNVGLFLTLANDGNGSDALTSVSAPAATSVALRVGATDRKEGIHVEVPPGGVASLQYPGGPHFELVELKHDIGRGTFLPVTFHFQRAGDVEVNVFIQAFDRPIVTPLSSS